jgi:hypothetical protein
MGRNGQYAEGYREDCKAGYAPRKWDATDLAFDTGYRDGVTAGQYDRGRNSRSDFQATDAYRNGSHGYGNAYGESASYQEHYRTGFERGYRDGFCRRR